jgi:hypothetical protein
MDHMRVRARTIVIFFTAVLVGYSIWTPIEQGTRTPRTVNANPGDVRDGSPAQDHPEVGFLRDPGMNAAVCTGTLIGTRSVLTAGRCPCQRIQASIDEGNCSVQGKMHRLFILVAGGEEYPFYGGVFQRLGNGYSGTDEMALFQLSDRVPPAIATPARIGADSPPTPLLPWGQWEFTVIGYGCGRGSDSTIQRQNRTYTRRPGLVLPTCGSGAPHFGNDGLLYLVTPIYRAPALFDDAFLSVAPKLDQIQSLLREWE